MSRSISNCIFCPHARIANFIFAVFSGERGRLAASWGPNGGDGREMQLSFRGVSWSIIFEPLARATEEGRQWGSPPKWKWLTRPSLWLRWPPSFFLTRKVAAHDPCTFGPPACNRATRTRCPEWEGGAPTDSLPDGLTDGAFNESRRSNNHQSPTNLGQVQRKERPFQ